MTKGPFLSKPSTVCRALTGVARRSFDLWRKRAGKLNRTHKENRGVMIDF